MRKFLFVLALSVPAAFVAPESAFAQDEGCQPLSLASWTTEMNAIDESIGSMDIDTARGLVDHLYKQLPCLTELAKPSMIGRFARQHAQIAFFDQDEDTAQKWGLLQRIVAPDLPWPDSIGEDHPFRQLVTEADLPPQGGRTNASILVDKGKGYAFMNGVPLLEPKAYAEIPNLVQLTDKKGVVTKSYWQDGAAFPDTVIGPFGPKPVAPKFYVPEGAPGSTASNVASNVATATTPKPVKPTPTQSSTTTTPKPSGGGPNIIRLGIGGGLVVVAGVLYSVGAVEAGHVTNGSATSAEQLVSARSTANALALSSGVVALGGVGVGVTAFIVDQGAGVGIHTRF